MAKTSCHICKATVSRGYDLDFIINCIKRNLFASLHSRVEPSSC
jgi:hypothetical protein